MTPLVTLAMAVSAGAAAANVWYNAPMLGAIAAGFAVSDRAVSLIPMATQLGFAAGIVLLVPLGDRMDRRRLILGQLAALTVALVAAAVAPGLVWLVAASFLIGACASTAQQIVPFAAELAPADARGHVVGVVMSGLLTGILLARVLSGVVAEHFGWAAMFWLGGGMCVLVAAILATVLPRSVPTVSASYAHLVASLATLVRAYRPLRRATLIQACLFGAFTAFWSVLALLLQGPGYRLGPTAAGLFGLVGAGGILAAPLAGRITDRRGPRGVIGLGILLVAVAVGLFLVWPGLAGLVVGVVLMDSGVQASLVANQAIIFALQPAARGRLNTVFMTGMFLGGAAGSAGGGLAWSLGRWPAVCGFCLGLSVLAFGLHCFRGPARQRVKPDVT
jgi:predicted MFS family arabinose efflux permease